jgi:hypothetical protein
VKASGTIRPLGPFEHMFWLLDQNRSVHFAVTAQIAGKERTQTIGVATVNGSICLTHTSHTPPEGLLEAMRGVLVDACK